MTISAVMHALQQFLLLGVEFEIHRHRNLMRAIPKTNTTIPPMTAANAANLHRDPNVVSPSFIELGDVTIRVRQITSIRELQCRPTLRLWVAARTKQRRALVSLEPTFEFPIALQHARGFKRDPILADALGQPRALPAQVLSKPRLNVIGTARVMVCLFVAWLKVNQADISYLPNFSTRDERARRFPSERVRHGPVIQLKDSVKGGLHALGITFARGQQTAQTMFHGSSPNALRERGRARFEHKSRCLVG